MSAVSGKDRSAFCNGLHELGRIYDVSEEQCAERLDEHEKLEFAGTPELRRQRKRAGRRADKLLRRIRRHQEGGNLHAARHLAGVYLKSTDARYAAAVEVNRRDRRPFRHREMTPEQVAARMRDSGWHHPTDEQIQLKLKSKKSGAHRPIFGYGTEDRTWQTLVRRLLDARSQPHPAQFLQQGGRHAAVETARATMEERRNSNRYKHTHYLCADLRDAYGSIRAEKLPSLLKDILPAKLTFHAITNLGKQQNAKLKQDVTTNPIRTTSKSSPTPSPRMQPEAAVRAACQGLPQGSGASSIVAEKIIGDVLASVRLAKGVHLCVYADNILIIGSAIGVRRAYMDLRSAFARSPAGVMELREEGCGRLRDGFDWLGYHLERKRGAKVRPSAANLIKARARLLEIMALVAAQREPITAVKNMLSGFVANFRAADVWSAALSWIRGFRWKLGDRSLIGEALDRATGFIVDNWAARNAASR